MAYELSRNEVPHQFDPKAGDLVGYTGRAAVGIVITCGEDSFYCRIHWLTDIGSDSVRFTLKENLRPFKGTLTLTQE